MNQDFYTYGPILTSEGDELSVYLSRNALTQEEIEMLDDGDDDFLLEGGQVQAFYVPQKYVDYITIYLCETKEEKEISYEEYIARINGNTFRDVDFFIRREALPEEVRVALDDAVGSDYWDGAIYRGNEYAAVVKDDAYYATYSITLQAQKV